MDFKNTDSLISDELYRVNIEVMEFYRVSIELIEYFI